MTSIVAICNLALSNIGKDNINALNEATAEARACNQFYEHVRDTLLQAYPWRFATGLVSLAAIANDKPEEWQYAYARPTDCLKVRSIGPTRKDALFNDSSVKFLPYDVASEVIYCDASPAYLNYTKRLTDPAKYPVLFIEALAWHLAVRLSMPLTRDPRVRADAFELATRMQVAAEMADANEVRNFYDHDTEYVEGRG